MSDQPATITRFAPSPTGHLHIGGARTALFCWALAERAKRESGGGSFLLRIEDTDQARSSADAAAGILEDLAWLGIAWDEGPEFVGGGASPIGGDPRGVGPFHQSQRREVYDRFFTQLLEAGLAYPAFETPEDLAELRKAAEADKKTFIYRQREDYDRAAAWDRMPDQPHVLRLRLPAEPITVRDEVLGEVTFPYEEVDDFVIRKADGFPTYHMAVVVDDALMGVTHVLRGQEHLNNTPKHVALQRALGFETPAYAHMPLIFNPDGTKMSKRDKDKAAKKSIREAKIGSIGELQAGDGTIAGVTDADFAEWLKDKSRQLGREQLAQIADRLVLDLPEIDVEDFRAAGYLPGVLCNFLALLGWNPGMKNGDGTDLERFDHAFLAEHFSTERVGKSNAKFDRDKLAAFNADTIQHGMSDDEFAAVWLAWAERFDTELAGWAHEDEARWKVAAAAAKPRCKVLRDGRGVIAFALPGYEIEDYDDKAVKKHLLKGEPRGVDVLQRLATTLSDANAWSPNVIDAEIDRFVQAEGIGMGKAAQPLRIAMTGSAVSPPLGLTLGLLHRDDALGRIRRCLDACGTDVTG